MEDFEISGFWWFPGEKRTRSTTGTLSYTTRGGGELSVFGKDLEGLKFVEPVMFGDTADGPVTLYDVTLDESRWNSRSEHFAQSLSCSTVIKGGHFPRDCRFRRAGLSVSHLDEWARLGRFKPLSAQVVNAASKVQWGSYFEDSPSVNAALSDGTDVSLGTGLSSKNSLSTAELTAQHYFSLSFPKSKTIGQIVDEYARPLSNLVTLATGEPSSIIELSVFDRARTPSSPIPYGVGIHAGVHAPVHYRTTSPGSQILRFEDFSFATQLGTWFELDRRLRGIHGLIFGLRHAENMTVENRFLNAVTAAEALHRETFVSTRAKLNFKNQATKAWLDQYPQDERNLIKSRLSAYINDPGLGNRLSELAGKAGVAFTNLVPDLVRWQKLVKDTRNALTHQEGTPKVPVTSTEMFYLAESVALLVQMCLLRDIGVGPDEMEKAYARPQRSLLIADGLRNFV